MADKPLCKIEGCGKQASKRGWCDPHYKRWWRSGDPLGGKTSPGEPLRFLEELVGHDGDDCVTWPFCTAATGIGSVQYGGKVRPAHRVMLYLSTGVEPDSKVLALHSCGNGHLGCVNPKHLRWGSAKDNAQDAILHKTTQRGEKAYNAILTEDDVRGIRRELRNLSGKKVAEKYGCSQQTVCDIKMGRRWGWLKD